MRLRYQYRVYPTSGQVERLARLFGCVRTVWNDALEQIIPIKRSNKLLGPPRSRLAEGPYRRVPNSYDLYRPLVSEARRTPEREWLREVAAVPLQQTLRHLDRAWKAHEDSKSGKRKGPHVGAPKFKSRRDGRQSACFTRTSGWKVTEAGRLSLPKVGEIPVVWSRSLPAPPSSVTIIKDASDRYFASFVVTVENTPMPDTDDDVAIDLGLTHFAVLSDGTRIANPRFLRRAERKLRKAHRSISRKQKGSNNRAKARLRLARTHAQVTDARRDFQHKLSTRIIRENQTVYAEDLDVRSLLSCSRSAKSVHDAAWSTFLRMLTYKASLHGRTFHKVDRFLPTTQTCSQCASINGPKSLHVRTWQCRKCATIHDRDVNASLVILAAGRAERIKACGGIVSPTARAVGVSQ
ncbi:RNA-guided endonuclease TnpB family protein [Nocardiopsis sp. RSe5-2]|uniref:RNA-guided endonuclease TnpB family protein n=1 Tax=Nocardiopsis endophytica TaxID=3018445 RepID=A0ABT4TZ62_9ACTN|nr:RNA-guided endonuclease TnpB family protein [Nocardiopsis endophytica]MDA2809996.1 RNA-guided endonuclease TnpB family protein [Nocardiopsis endophytica]